MGELRKIVQGNDACPIRGQGRGNLRVAGVCEAFRSIYYVAVDFGVERIADLGCGPRKLNGGTTWCDFDSLKPLGAQPACGGLDVGVSGSKLRAELLGSQPSVMLWGIQSELIIQ